eukprot:TRINITY_DN73662_c0_g1_i1.p1 TRINITY_DN73662_c0_g1~~TRINITY_DN73662_c0_g1_i1.p1  ORF type:complete len:784 (-),score=120.89 TRINITY_DN73662_c0_g1_i1:33-2384(-)
MQPLATPVSQRPPGAATTRYRGILIPGCNHWQQQCRNSHHELQLTDIAGGAEFPLSEVVLYFVGTAGVVCLGAATLAASYRRRRSDRRCGWAAAAVKVASEYKREEDVDVAVRGSNEASPSSLLNCLSEEELLASELDDEDLLLGEEEEEEWRQYDEEVRQFQQLMTDCNAAIPDANWTSSSDVSPDAELLAADSLDARDNLDQLLQSNPGMQGTLQALLKPSEMEDVVTAASRLTPWAPGAGSANAGAAGVQLPEEYRERLAEPGGGVVVSDSLGPNTTVLLSRMADQPDLLPVVSETFRLQRVSILRGWLETTEDGRLDAFEVCDALTGERLSSAGVARLETALVVAFRAPSARQVLFEIANQVPTLDCFFGLPPGGSRPLPMSSARGVLMGSPFKVSECKDLGRALFFRGSLEEGLKADEALDECSDLLRKATAVAPAEIEDARVSRSKGDEWDCLLLNGVSGPLLLWLPLRELEQELDPAMDQRLIFMLTTLASLVCTQLAAQEPGLGQPIGALLLSIIGASELSRRVAASNHGVRLGLPLLLPSPAMGCFGAAVRTRSLVPSAMSLFDIAAAALTSAMLASLILLGLGLLIPQEASSCTWVNPSTFPFVLRQLLLAQAEARMAVCTEPPSDLGARFVPTSPAVAAGAFGLLMASLNSLPLGRLDGTALASAAPWAVLREVVLPYSALLLLGSTIFGGPDADSYFPLVLGFGIFTYGVRPQLSPEPVMRDNVSRPADLPRQLLAALLVLASYLLLMPAGWWRLLVVVWEWPNSWTSGST